MGTASFVPISYLITGCQDYNYQIRQLITKHILRHKTLFKKVTPNGIAVDEYLFRSKMAQNTDWATEVELIATAHILKTDIDVYCEVGSKMKWLSYSGKFVEENLETELCNLYFISQKRKSLWCSHDHQKQPWLFTNSYKLWKYYSKSCARRSEDRTEYLRQYKQKQRQYSTFRTLEKEKKNQSIKTCRSDEKYRQIKNEKRNTTRQTKR